MNNALFTFLTTSKGWIVRQLLKLVAGGLASFGAWVEAKAEVLNLPAEKVGALLSSTEAFATALVLILVEVGLSFVARKKS